MPYVEIYKLKNDGSQEVAATCRLSGQSVVCEGEGALISRLSGEGIKDYEHSEEHKTLFLSDGIVFLKNLKHAFRSGYLMASDIKND